MQLQVKLQEAAEITYVQGNKQQTRYRLTYWDVLEAKKKKYD